MRFKAMLTPRSAVQPRLKRRGASAVEFAVIAPVVFAVIFGMIEYGRYFLLQHVLTEAARRACLQASTIQAAQATTAGYASGNAMIDAQTITPLMQQNAITGWTSVYKIDDATTSNVASAKGTYSNGSNLYGQKVSVTVSVPWRNVSWLPGSLTSVFAGGDPKGYYSFTKE